MRQACTFLCGTMLASVALLAGCRSAPAPPPPLPPTLPLDQLVARINANNRLLPTLWANHDFEATIVDKNRETFVNGSGSLMMLKPRDLYFVGNKAGLTRLVEMGSNQDQFWLTIPEHNRTWVGQHRNIGKPCMGQMPVRPDMVLEILGVGDIDSNLSSPPFPVVRINPDERVYMVVWNAPAPDRFYAQKEIWYDVDSLLPVKVLLFDLQGRVMLRANLAQHRAVPIEGLPAEQHPRLATDLRLLFPETRSRMWIRLSNLQLKKNDRPRPGLIRYLVPEGFEVIRVDADCP